MSGLWSGLRFRKEAYEGGRLVGLGHKTALCLFLLKALIRLLPSSLVTAIMISPVVSATWKSWPTRALAFMLEFLRVFPFVALMTSPLSDRALTSSAVALLCVPLFPR